MNKSPHPKYHDIIPQKKTLIVRAINNCNEGIIWNNISFVFVLSIMYSRDAQIQINTNTDEMLLFIYSCYAPAFPLQILGNWVYHKGCDNHSSRIVAIDVYGPLTFGRNN